MTHLQWSADSQRCDADVPGTSLEGAGSGSARRAVPHPGWPGLLAQSRQVALGLGLSGLALLACVALTRFMPGQSLAALTFFPAVLLGACLGGMPAGLAAAGVGIATVCWLFAPGLRTPFAVPAADLAGIVLYSTLLLFQGVAPAVLRRRKLALARRAGELQTLLDHSPDVLTRFDSALRHRFVSKAIEEVAGRPAADMVGRTNRELGMPGSLCEQWDAALRTVLRSGAPVTLEFQFGQRHFSARLVPERGRDRAVASVIGVTRDVTDLVMHRQALEAQDRFKDQFVATLAHELRNPLAVLRTGVELFKRRPGADVAARTVAMMERQMRHVSRLVNDLLDVARVRQNQLRLEVAPTDLSVAILNAIESCTAQMDDEGVHLVVDSLPQPMPMVGELGKLVQVFCNLLSNASKFSKRDGLVRLSATVAQHVYVVTIDDSGPGIGADMLERVFDPFVQGEAGLARKSGLGIGLSLVRRIVELHGGSVRAESKGLGHGASFVVTLPIA